MMKNFSFWFKAAFITQLLTAAIHALSFFNNPLPKNETEKQLFELMRNYRKDFGAGFTPSMDNFLTSLSADFALLLLLGGLLNWYLWKKKIDSSILKGVIGINLIVFGICFVQTAIFTFLPPIILTGLIFIFFLLAWFTSSKKNPA